MVFGFDDIAFDSGVLAVLTGIITTLFPDIAGTIANLSTTAIEGASIGATSTALGATSTFPILAESEYLVIQDLLGEDGLEAVISMADGSTKSYENLPIYEKWYDLSEKVYNVTLQNNNITQDKTTFIQNISKLIDSLSKKIPTTSDGFINLVQDIVKGAINNPQRTIAYGASAVGIAGLSYGVVKQIKKSFDNGEKLPKDVQDLIDDGKLTISDIKQTINDATSSIIPDVQNSISSILPKSFS